MAIEAETLKDFLAESHDLREQKSKFAKESVRLECSNGLASTAAGISSLYAVWRVFRARQPDQPVSETQSDLANILVANHLSWLCNTVIGIRTLVFQGLEPQAKVLLRSFLEATHQTLVLFYDRESRNMYFKGWDNASSKMAYYEAFSKKRRLQKKLQEIEELALKHLSIDGQQQLKERIESLEFYSQATHASFRHVFLSGLQPNEEGGFSDTILGHPTVASENTLLNCSHEIAYFAVLFDFIVKNVWNSRGIADSDDYRLFSNMASLAAKFRTHKVKNSEHTADGRQPTTRPESK